MVSQPIIMIHVFETFSLYAELVTSSTSYTLEWLSYFSAPAEMHNDPRCMQSHNMLLLHNILLHSSEVKRALIFS